MPRKSGSSHTRLKVLASRRPGLAEPCGQLCAAIFAEKFASTTAPAPSTPPTAPTTARFRSASSFLTTPTTSSPPSPLCREFGAPLLCRGGGTSLAGQCCNVAVVLDFSKYMARILEIDPARRIARVQPGVVLDTLRNAAEKHHLTFAPDPASHDRCTIGGMIGNNSCGVHSVMAGKTDDNIEAAGSRHLRRHPPDGWRRFYSRIHVGTAAPGCPSGPEVSGRSNDRRDQIHHRPQANRRPTTAI